MLYNNSSGRRLEGSLVFLDGLRGLSAFYVMVGHARWLLWEGYSKGYLLHTQDYNVFEKILVYFFSVFRYGNEAVLFFFVLSGFVIHLRYSSALKEDSQRAVFDWLPFIKRRARRLYPPLLLTLLVTFIADKSGPQFEYSTLRAIPSYLNVSALVVPSHSLNTALGNLLFLMNAYVPVWGTNGPLWSLNNEWWFYMFYPTFWFMSKHSIAGASMLMVALFILAPQVDLGPAKLIGNVFGAMLVWWLGVILADVYTKRIRVNIHWFSIFILFLPFLLAKCIPMFWEQVVWGICFTGLIAFCLFLQSIHIRLRILESLKWLGNMSYTLYVVHFPVLFLISRWLLLKSPDHRHLPMHFYWVFVGGLICLGLAYASHFIVEKPFLSRSRSKAAVGARG